MMHLTLLAAHTLNSRLRGNGENELNKPSLGTMVGMPFDHHYRTIQRLGHNHSD